jgi:hypothetical protein
MAIFEINEILGGANHCLDVILATAIRLKMAARVDFLHARN